ncbi:DUF3829 domain-containing protein [Lacrimispora sp. 210928-DFI.3.58]|uniref:DUF3829 domain-containing protein n=1 Tax=Lacrimispora sp. 210928-DFI.3.58 TaxID=2883214 RepID=UPI0015B7201D|nr:DUF3829 domain-containing protein [Lacrimispora sp. 210928-DFI.3.58]MCB7320407.1 YiiG family protein [Lacrimispora sp. 210928-DFI.3.58]
MKKQVMAAVCAAAMTASMITGCGGDGESKKAFPVEALTAEETKEKKEEEAGTESAEEAEASALEEEAADLELYNLYIDINNIMVDRFSDVIASYFKYVDFQEEFVPLDEDYWCLSSVSTFYTKMDDAKELAEQKKEKDELDEIFLSLYPAMYELATTLDEVEEYTDMKSYLDDDYAKGKELHAVIWKDYAEYETLGNAFLDKLSAVAAERREASMEQLKADGYEATYAINKMIDTAQEIQTAIYEQGIDDTCILELDIEALQELYDQYVEEVQICLDYLADEDGMYEEGYPINSGYFSLFDDAIKESKTTLTELFQRVREQKPVDEFMLRSSFAEDGTIQKFNETISEIIDDYNKMLSY